MKEPHVKRKTREQSIRDKILQGLPIILWHQINKLKAYYIEVSRINLNKFIENIRIKNFLFSCVIQKKITNV